MERKSLGERTERGDLVILDFVSYMESLGSAEEISGSRVAVSCLTRGASLIKNLGVKTVLEIEQQIEGLPVEDFAELAAWMWERVEDDSMLRACVDAVEEGNERASRDEIFAILDRK